MRASEIQPGDQLPTYDRLGVLYTVVSVEPRRRGQIAISIRWESDGQPGVRVFDADQEIHFTRPDQAEQQ